MAFSERYIKADEVDTAELARCVAEAVEVEETDNENEVTYAETLLADEQGFAYILFTTDEVEELDDDEHRAWVMGQFEDGKLTAYLLTSECPMEGTDY